MRFKKIVEGVGDFHSLNVPALVGELTTLLGPAQGMWNYSIIGAYLVINDLTADGTVAAQFSAIQALVQTHGTMSQNDRDQAKEDADFNAGIDADLVEMDRQSIRYLREQEVGRPNSPQELKDINSRAETRRGQRRP